jgi:hypothetical protein
MHFVCSNELDDVHWSIRVHGLADDAEVVGSDTAEAHPLTPVVEIVCVWATVVIKMEHDCLVLVLPVAVAVSTVGDVDSEHVVL